VDVSFFAGWHGKNMLRDDGHRTAIALSLSILCLYLVLAIALHFFGISHVDAYKLDDLITTDVIHEDQTTSYYPGNVFTPPLKSDTLYVHIPLPKKRWVPSAMLCFSYYNARVQIYAADNRVIYSSTASDLISDGVTGHMIVKATIPNNCWGKALDVRIEPLEDNTTFVISGVYVLRSYDSVWYPVLLAGQFTYTLILFLLLASLLLLCIFLIMKLRGMPIADGVCLMLFCITGCIWALCYTGLIYMCTTSIRLAAFGEYYIVYLTMPLLAGYFALQNLKPKVKAYFAVLTVGLSILALLSFIGEVRQASFNVVSLIPVFRGSLLLVLFSCMPVILSSRGRRDASRMVQGIGLFLTFILLILELLRTFFVRYAGQDISKIRFLAEANLTMLICIVFASSLLISYLSRLMRARQVEQENETLQILATRDALTGIPNRLSIEQSMEELTASGTQRYVMFFFDANNLKKANDVYGHECGDELLKLIGRALREAHDGMQGFFGRYGGDEFVACITEPEESQVKRFESNFTEIIEKANAEHYLPFEVSVAMGKALHSAGEAETETPEDVLKTADDRMYENKLRMKGAGNAR
jgi:diguanylate cyclase (GGDEF)-like protein